MFKGICGKEISNAGNPNLAIQLGLFSGSTVKFSPFQ